VIALADVDSWPRDVLGPCLGFTFGLCCAFEAASIVVTGRLDEDAPGIVETRQLISRTA
jgi:hypothetical protein